MSKKYIPKIGPNYYSRAFQVRVEKKNALILNDPEKRCYLQLLDDLGANITDEELEELKKCKKEDGYLVYRKIRDSRYYS